MKKKHGVFFGFAVLLMAVIFTMAVTTEASAQGITKDFLVGTWVYKGFLSTSKVEFTADSYKYYRVENTVQSSGSYQIIGNTVKLLNENGDEWEEITISGNSFTLWGSKFTKEAKN
jgi:hypothetical protein